MTELNNTEPYTHGQEVMVFDHRGNYEGRGKVVGVHRCNPWQYDIQPRGESSLSKRQCGIHHDRIRPIGKPYLAYDRKDEQPKYIMDEV